MRGAVQDHVHRRENAESRLARERPRSRQQLGRVGFQTRRDRQDRVVHVEQRLPADVPKRRQLVHPPAVIALVISRRLARVPAVEQQRRFDVRERALWNQDIDVGKHPPASGRQAGDEVGSPLEQDDGNAGGGEGPIDERDFAPNRVGLCLRQRPRCLEVDARRGRHVRQEPEIVEDRGDARQEAGATCLADERFPLRKAQARQGRRVAQRADDRIWANEAHARSAASSNTAIVSSSAPY